MSVALKKIYEGYCNIGLFLFFAFIFCTLSFGRAFSILCVNTPFTPLYVTEMFLLLNIPVLLYKYKTLNRLPRVFLAVISIYFVYAFSFLCAGILKRNVFALRDITLSLYVLFLPITLIYLDSPKRFKFLIAVIILANMINLSLGLCISTDMYPSWFFVKVLSKIKMAQFGLYYAIASSFIFSFYGSIKKRAHRALAVILLSINIYVLVICPSTSFWFMALTTFAFLSIMLKKRFLKILLCSAAILAIVVGLVMSCGRSSESARVNSVLGEAKGIDMFLSENLYMEKLEETAIVATSRQEENALNISWRLSIWNQTLNFVGGSVLFGKGFGQYPVYRISKTLQHPHGIYTDSGMVPAHNDLVTVFFKMGILGLSLFLFINAFVFIYGLSYTRKGNSAFIGNLVIALLGAFVSWHSLALFFDIIDSPPTNIFLWIIMGAVFAAIEIDKGHPKEGYDA